MSCISLELRMLNEPLVLSTERIGGISVNASLVNKLIKINTFDAVIHLIVKVKAVPNLKVRTSIVCSIGNKRYLNVSPDEIQWITPDCGVIYTVESNTKWIISNS